jgi:N-acetylmuramoyl-L-alanine amidase
MLHFDDSSNDASAWQWFLSKKCKVSYNYLILDNGDIVQVIPIGKRAWHAGRCRPSGRSVNYKDANSAFYGVAIATNNDHPATEAQKKSIIELCRFLYSKHNWRMAETHRITGHDWEAWERGRKIDPTGTNKDKPVLLVTEVRELFK